MWRAHNDDMGLGEMFNSATIQAQIQGFELAHSDIYFIYELWEHVEGQCADWKLKESYDTGQQQAIQKESCEDPV